MEDEKKNANTLHVFRLLLKVNIQTTQSIKYVYRYVYILK